MPTSSAPLLLDPAQPVALLGERVHRLGHRADLGRPLLLHPCRVLPGGEPAECALHAFEGPDQGTGGSQRRVNGDGQRRDQQGADTCEIDVDDPVGAVVQPFGFRGQLVFQRVVGGIERVVQDAAHPGEPGRLLAVRSGSHLLVGDA